MLLRDALLSEFDQELAKTRTVLERCPEEKFAWKPHPKSWDMASLATHVANVPGWTADTHRPGIFRHPVPALYGPSADES